MAATPATWALKFPVYQIDFGAAASGKRVAATKRRIRWRFGFPNKTALGQGQTGTDCRGEEHDVTVVWSITSGKRQVSMDGREIHYSTSRAGVLDFSWSTKGNHVMKVVCHAAPPMSATPGFRQYDLMIDGQSFFRMPKVYELGIKGPIPSHARVPGSAYSNPTSPISMESGSLGRSAAYYNAVPSSREQEEEDLRRAVQASIEESRRHLQRGGDDNRSAQSAPRPTGTADLLDFGGPAPPVQAPPPPQPTADARSVSSMPSYYSAPPSYSQAPYQSPPAIQQGYPVASPQPAVGPGAIVPSHGPPGAYYGALPPTTPTYASRPPGPPVPAPTPPQHYASAPAPSQHMVNTPTYNSDVFGLNSPAQEDPFAPKPPPPPTQQDFASAILGAYTSPPGSAPQTPAGGMPPNGGFAPSPDGQPQANGYSPGPQSSAGSMSMNVLMLVEEEKPKSEFESAMQKLVNIDRIDEPAEGVLKLTMIKQEEAKKAPKGKSVPLPPVASGMVGQNATLGQIKQVKPTGPSMYETEGVMNAPPPGLFQPGAPNAGVLVVHGQGPPPLNQATGFGVGARMQNGGFGHHPQQQQPQPQPQHMGYQQQPQYR